MKERTLFVAAILSIAAYSCIQSQEVKAYDKAFTEADAGYASFLQRSVNGKPLHSLVKPDSIAVFKIANESMACGLLAVPLPDRPK